jgi:hypothetical protein
MVSMGFFAQTTIFSLEVTVSINEVGVRVYRRLQRCYAAGYEGKHLPIDLRRINRTERGWLRNAHADGLEERERMALFLERMGA